MKTITRNVLIAFFVCGGVLSAHAQTERQVDMIRAASDIAKLKSLGAQFAKENQDNYAKALLLAQQNGWPLKVERRDGGHNELIGVSEDGQPLYYGTTNHGSAITSRVNRIQGGNDGLNLDGTNMIAGEWDEGAPKTTHVALVNRVISNDGITTIADHSTHVAGTIIGDGTASAGVVGGPGTAADGIPPGRGMAYKAKLWYNDWNNDTSEMADAASRGLLVSNHSYGLSSATPSIYGAYDDKSKALDDLTVAAPYYQPCIAAGNDRVNVATGKNGHDLLSEFGTSKNSVVVAAVYEVPNYVDSDNVVMSPFSSYGPTDDNRVKPDVSTKGVQVWSTYTASNTDYHFDDGTSMATPGITGTLLLIQQHYSNVNPGANPPFMRAATLRGLMINCVDETGDFLGPDSKFGWGLMNAQRMAKVITDAVSTDVTPAKTIISELSLAQGQTYTTTFQASGAEPLVATISWNDPSGTANASSPDVVNPTLVNDLDLRVTKDTTTYFPWKLAPMTSNVGSLDAKPLQADNTVDNVEKVEIQTPVSGTYTINVTHKGTLVGGNQKFSLVVRGTGQYLGVEQNDFKEFNIWPNPLKDVVNVSIKSDLSEDAFVTLYDIQGRRVTDQKLDSTSDMMQGTLNVSSLNTGIYLVKVTQGNKQSVRKIIKD